MGANPAVTVGRMLWFAGTAPSSAPSFVCAEALGGLIGVVASRRSTQKVGVKVLGKGDLDGTGSGHVVSIHSQAASMRDDRGSVRGHERNFAAAAVALGRRWSSLSAPAGERLRAPRRRSARGPGPSASAGISRAKAPPPTSVGDDLRTCRRVDDEDKSTGQGGYSAATLKATRCIYS